MGYTAQEINEARRYITDYDALPAWKRTVRRTANSIGGVIDMVAAAPFQIGENLVQSVKNISDSAANRKALDAEVQGNRRKKHLYDCLMETDMDYQPKYSTGDLLQMGFTRQEIDDMRARIAGTEAHGSVDTEKSIGHQLYER